MRPSRRWLIAGGQTSHRSARDPRTSRRPSGGLRLSAVAGFALGNRYPLTSLVERIERNGVAAAHGDERSVTLPNKHASTNEGAPLPEPNPVLPLPQAFVAPIVLNPGTAETAPQPPETQPIPEGTRPKERPRVRVAQSGDRRVFVVVRRVGPP
jgi:hypothetical protein